MLFTNCSNIGGLVGLMVSWSIGWWWYGQSSYLSQISQTIFVGKKISCGEILGNFENFLEIFGDFATIYALSHGEKLSPKSTFGDTKYVVWIWRASSPMMVDRVKGSRAVRRRPNIRISRASYSQVPTVQTHFFRRGILWLKTILWPQIYCSSVEPSFTFLVAKNVVSNLKNLQFLQAIKIAHWHDECNIEFASNLVAWILKIGLLQKDK